ncbi:hypothetical protein EV182_007974 [Spiromyces aspiralis]|uniref:Uncharacterized protein n=1 Tax=Spiromyces aspiralis TaxID=68401 RepID=A0ACC1HDL8_9FUNG|nr:hypothetical protein EV182_007974 [Spiromyces aspiralis]
MGGLVRQSAKAILDRGGVVRGFWSLQKDAKLPYRMKRHQEYHTEGHYWVMHYDCNPLTNKQLMDQLKLDQRVIRHNVVKLGSVLENIITHPSRTIS